MAISRVGSAIAAATSITIPAGHQAGDYMLIFAFNSGAATAPTLPAGWTSIQSSTLNSVGSNLGFRQALSSAETSGTWTNATSIVAVVYRNTATNKAVKATLSTNGIMNANNNTNIVWQALQPMQCPGTSWVVSFAAIKSINTGLSSGPTLLPNIQSNVTGVEQACAYDSNGPLQYFCTFPPYGNPVSSLGTSIGGTAGAWHTYTIEIMAEQLNIQNYMSTKVASGMSAGERIR